MSWYTKIAMPIPLDDFNHRDDYFKAPPPIQKNIQFNRDGYGSIGHEDVPGGAIAWLYIRGKFIEKMFTEGSGGMRHVEMGDEAMNTAERQDYQRLLDAESIGGPLDYFDIKKIPYWRGHYEVVSKRCSVSLANGNTANSNASAIENMLKNRFGQDTEVLFFGS